MSNILLINPNTGPAGFARMRMEAYPHLGLAYIASYLRSNGINVDLIDANALNMSLQKIRREITRRKADIVGITATTATIGIALKTAKVAKKIGCQVILGGVHSTVMHEKLVEDPNIDFCVRGEGEKTMLELAKARETGAELKSIRGITYKDDYNKVIVTPDREPILDLDSLPFPAWDMLPIKKYYVYTAERRPCVTMLISRGCQFKCVHCSSQIIFKRKFRCRSAKNVVDEMDMLVNYHGVKFIYFVDFCFALKRDVVMGISEEIRKRNLDILWWAETRADTIDRELLQAMNNAGCTNICFGVESGSQQILNNLRRGLKLDQIRKAFKLAKEVGLKTGATFMIGCPGETKETVDQTIKFAIELDPDEVQFSIFTPYPGTEYYEIAKEKGLISHNFWESTFTYFPEQIGFRSENLSTDELKVLYKKAYKDFYFRWSYIARWKRLKSLMNRSYLKRFVLSVPGLLKLLQ